MPVDTTNGMFPLIQALPHEVVPPLQVFQQQVEDEILLVSGSGADVVGPVLIEP